MVQPRVGRPASDDGCRRTAKQQAMQRRDAAGPQPQRAMRCGADRAFGRFQPHDLAVARGAGNAQNQIAAGSVQQGRSFRCKRGGNHSPAPSGGINAKSSTGFSLRHGNGQNLDPGARGGLTRIDEKRLYIFAGFDDYRIATWERQVDSTRISTPISAARRRASPCLWAWETGFSGEISDPLALEICRFF